VEVKAMITSTHSQAVAADDAAHPVDRCNASARMAPFTLSHAQLREAAQSAAAVEARLHNWTPEKRYAWLTEVELGARIRSSLVHVQLVDPMFVKLQGAGRKGSAITRKPDVVFGEDEICIEVVYLFADATASPGEPFREDLAWVGGGPARHLVAFLPKMRAGYRVQNHRTPYDLKHSPLTLAAGEHLLTDSLQIGALDPDGCKLCEGVFCRVLNPPHGNVDRWTLGEVTALSPIGNVTRSLVGRFQDPLWAIVWSNV
jgi:hypothetical protein